MVCHLAALHENGPTRTYTNKEGLIHWEIDVNQSLNLLQSGSENIRLLDLPSGH